MQQMVSPSAQHVCMSPLTSPHPGEVMLDEPMIKYEPLDMSSLSRDPLNMQDATDKFPDLAAAMPSHMHQVSPYQQYQDPFLC
jgi:hypothetical protein